jgi:membrane fusion protein (multidrug efflux system)
MTRCIQAAAAALLAARAAFGAPLILPVAEVKGAVDNQAKTFPAKVVAMQRVDLAPEVSGEILEVCCADGALVKAGDVLFRLNPIKYKSNLKNAQAKVAECKSRKLYADSNFARHENAVKTKQAVSQDAVDKARSDRDVAASALEAAEAELAVAEYNLSHCEVKAPITGKVGTVRLTKGNYASPEKGALVTITQITPIRVRFSISSADFLRMFQGRSTMLKEKAAVEVVLADGSAFGEKGEIDYTENIADEATDTLRVYARFANAERVLRPGGTVGVTVRNKDGVVKPAVPPSAVMQDVQGPYVWVLDASGVAAKRPIVRGRMTGDRLFVAQGLSVGERVVTDGTHKVAPGDVVTPAP